MPITLPLDVARRKLAEGEALLSSMKAEGMPDERVIRAVTALRRAVAGSTSTSTINSLGNVEVAEVGGQAESLPRCWACGGSTRWESVHGRTVCATCHPPAVPELVRRVIGPKQ